MNKISVIVPCFNSEKFIGRCLRSLLNQSLDKKSYDIIVINDGSKDRTDFALKLFKEDIILINNKKNLGLPASLNLGINSSRSKFIVRVDSDDYVNFHFLEILSLYLSLNPNYRAASCDYYIVNENEEIIKRESFKKSPIGCAIMFHKDDLIDLGLYDESFLLNEEKNLMQKFFSKYEIINCKLPLYRYRRHENNITNDIEMLKFYDKKLQNNK